MDCFVPEGICFISTLGALMVFGKAELMSFCHSPRKRMAHLELLNSQLLLYCATVLCGEGFLSNAVYFGRVRHERVNLGLK